MHDRAILSAVRSANPGDDATDAELLRRFAEARDEAAFEALVRRHARLVWGVCRRVLGHAQDAEDAFQATFLVLARNPDKPRRWGTAAGFLFGVARRVALKARAGSAARPAHPTAPSPSPAPDPAAAAAVRELQAILDDEVGRLPEAYRAAFLLCVLEGRSRADAAAELGVRVGTLSGRLARARLLLRARLAKRGVQLASALALADLASAGSAAPPGVVRQAVVTGASGRVAPAIAALAGGPVWRYLPWAVAGLAACVALVAGLAGGRPVPATEPPAGKPIATRPTDGERGDPLPAGAAKRLGDPEFRHGNDVAASVLSPCGTWLATAGPGTIAVTEVTTGKRVRTLPSGGAVKSDGDGDDVAMTFSPSGRRLAVRVRDDGVRVWDVRTGDLDWRADAGRRIGFCRFGATDDEFFTVRTPWPQERRPLIAERDAWSLATLELLVRRPCDTAWADSPLDGSRFALRPAGGGKPDALVEWGTDAEIRTADYGAGGRLEGSPDGTRLYRMRDGKVELFARGRPAAVTVELPRSMSRVEKKVVTWPVRVGLSEDARELWAIRTVWSHLDADRTVYRWDAATGTPLPPLAGHIEMTKRVHFPAGGRTILTVGREGVIKTWDRTTGRQLWPAVELGHSARVGFSGDGSTFAVARLNLFDRYDTRTGARHSFESKEIGLDAWALSPNGASVAVPADDRRLTLLDARTGREVRTIGEPSEVGLARQLKFSADGSRLLADTLTGRPPGRAVLVWDVASGVSAAKVLDLSHPEFFPDGRTVVGLTQFVRVVTYDTATGKRATPFDLAGPLPDVPPDMAYYALAVSPDGRRVAAASEAGPVVVQDAKTGGVIARLPVFPYRQPIPGYKPECAVHLAFSPDGRFVAAGTSAHTVDVWEVASETRLARFAGHDATPSCVRFDAPGRSVWSASGDGIAYQWNLADGMRKPKNWDAAWEKLAAPTAADAYPSVLAVADDPRAGVAFLTAKFGQKGGGESARAAELRRGRVLHALSLAGTTDAKTLAAELVGGGK